MMITSFQSRVYVFIPDHMDMYMPKCIWGVTGRLCGVLASLPDLFRTHQPVTNVEGVDLSVCCRVLGTMTNPSVSCSSVRRMFAHYICVVIPDRTVVLRL
jgi:hypothetical protein